MEYGKGSENLQLDGHSLSCRQRFGRSFSEVHSWMDAPSWGLRRKHRKYRHNILESPKEALSRFGEGADLACIDHILRDFSPHYPDLSDDELYRLLVEKAKVRVTSFRQSLVAIKESGGEME